MEKRKSNGAKKALMVYIIIAVIAIVHPFFCRAHAGIKGSIKINSVFLISKEKIDTVSNFGELKDYYQVPEGYNIAATGSFEYGAMTLKCSYDFIISCAKKTCTENNYHGFGLVDVKKPDLFNTCCSANIVFFVRK